MRGARKGEIKYKKTSTTAKIRIRKGEILKQNESRMNLEKIKYKKKRKEIEKELERERHRRIDRDKKIKRK